MWTHEASAQTCTYSKAPSSGLASTAASTNGSGSVATRPNHCSLVSGSCHSWRRSSTWCSRVFQVRLNHSSSQEKRNAPATPFASSIRIMSAFIAMASCSV